METSTAITQLEKLFRMQKCLACQIRSLKPQSNQSEEDSELLYNILCKCSDWFDANLTKIKEWYSKTGLKTIPCPDYSSVQQDITYFKSIYESHLLNDCLSTFMECTDRSQQRELRKQKCLVKRIASIGPANCLSEEEIEVYRDLLKYLREKFDQNQMNIGRYMEDCDYGDQLQLCKQFDQFHQYFQSKLDGNVSIIKDVYSLLT